MPGAWLWYTLPLVAVLPAPAAATQAGEGLLAAPGPVAAVAAHPDDLEYFCGGSLARLAAGGAQVTAILCTSGERGGDPGRREAEQRAAAQCLGIGAVRFLRRPDRGLWDTPDLRQDLEAELARVAPRLLITFDPVFPYPIYVHRDHMAAGQAALAAAAGLARPPGCLLFHTSRPDVAVDITDHLEQKAAAFAAHRSQLPRLGASRLIAYHFARRFRRAEVFRHVENGSRPGEPK